MGVDDIRRRAGEDSLTRVPLEKPLNRTRINRARLTGHLAYGGGRVTVSYKQ